MVVLPPITCLAVESDYKFYLVYNVERDYLDVLSYNCLPMEYIIAVLQYHGWELIGEV